MLDDNTEKAQEENLEDDKKVDKKSSRKTKIKIKDERSAREKLALALNLFLSYFKIGLFTFGGGYAMIALIDREFVQKKKWINEVELYEIIAVAESTPGPIAINCATFVGYKILKFWGSLLATIAVCIPSFVIIYLISIFYDTFMSLKVVANAFEGIKVGIALMITSAGIGMLKKAKKNAFSIGVFLLSFAAACFIDIFNLNFSTIYLLLIGACAGIIAQIIRDAKAKKNNNASNGNLSEDEKTNKNAENSLDDKDIIAKENLKEDNSQSIVLSNESLAKESVDNLNENDKSTILKENSDEDTKSDKEGSL